MGKRPALVSAAAAALAAASAVAAPAQAQNASVAWSGAPEMREGEQRFKLRGRFQYDVQANDWEVLSEDGARSYVRRAFIGAQGRLSEHWRYKIDFVLNPGGGEASGSPAAGGADDVAVDDAFLEYAGDFFSFVVGESNITSPLEDRTSSLDTPFAERSSFVNAFGYGRAAGAALLIAGAGWTGAIGVYGDSLNNQDNNFALDEQASIGGRLTWTPIFETAPESYALVHLGLSARQRHGGDDALLRYRTRPLNGRGSRWIDSGAGAATFAAEGDFAYAAEFAAQYNAFGLTAEYARLEGEETAASGGAGFAHEGYYVDAHWSITGEPRAYRGNQGAFGAIAPARPVNQGGPGHWMVSARYDFIDLSDPAGVAATIGEQTGYAIGVDWIPLEHVRLKLNYAASEMDRTGGGADDEAEIVTLRAQFDF